jgi:thioredoxin-dependent peroxiredoxin
MGNPLSVGTPAPDFTLPRDGGGQVTLKDFSGRKVVLYFYPKADTPGCTKEAISFNALRKAFAEADTAILGVSADSVKAQDKFRDKYSLAFPLVSDETHRMLEAYGVWGEKSMYGKTFMGVERLTYLIDRQGRIAKVWPKVKVDGHVEEVLESAKLL